MRTFNHIFNSIEEFRDLVNKLHLREESSVLIRIHSGIHSADEMKYLIQSMKTLVPGASIIGCSAMHVINEGFVISNKCLISITVFSASKIQLYSADIYSEKGELLPGDTIAKDFLNRIEPEHGGFALVFYPLAYTRMEAFVDQVNSSCNNISMLGGAAYKMDDADNMRNDWNYTICDTEVSKNAVVVAYIQSEELKIYTNYICGIEPVGQSYVIECDDTIIRKVHGINSAQWYAQMLGKDTLDSNPALSHAFPVIQRNKKGVAYYVDYMSDTEHGEPYIQTVGELQTGASISLGYFDPIKIFEYIKDIVNEINQEPVETIFAYDCQSRMSLLSDCASWEIGNFATTNISGALLAGEISSYKKDNLYANYTFCLAALSESEDARVRLPHPDISKVSLLQQDNVQMLNYLLLNANKLLDEEVRSQQKQMQDAMFFNVSLDMDNQLKFQYDLEVENIEKSAIFSLSNEKMFRLFVGNTQMYMFLKETYHSLKERYANKGLHFYGYEDTSLLLAADNTLSNDEFLTIVDEVESFLSGANYEEMSLVYTVAILLSKEDPISRLESALYYARLNKARRIRFDEIGDKLDKNKDDMHVLWVLKEALLHHRIVPYYQEIIDNKGGNTRMFESLMRVMDDEGNVYYPNQFLPVSKEYGLYESISELMVRTVVEQFENKEARVTINLNIQDIYCRSLLHYLFQKMQTVPHPENFVFELVESEEITDYEYIKEFADRIHEYGAKIAIDDFGSGFSNFLHVLKLGADYIKIDGEIIKTITTDQQCRDFIVFMNDWCEKAGQELICEFVENKEIQDVMVQIGVHHSQGYYFSKPHPWGTGDESFHERV